LDTVTFLLSRGADINAVYYREWGMERSVISFAAVLLHEDIVNALLETPTSERIDIGR
jgi:hypothetical protein